VHKLHAGPIFNKLPPTQLALKELLPFLDVFSPQVFHQEFFEENVDIKKVNPHDEAQSKKVIISFEKMALTQSFIDCINAKLPTEKIRPETLGKGLEEDLLYLESFRGKLPHSDTYIDAHDALTKLKIEVRKEYGERTIILSSFQKLMETKVGKLLLTRILVAIKKIDTSPSDSRCPRIVIGYGDKFSVSHGDNGKSILRIRMNDKAVPAFNLVKEHDKLVLPVKFSLFNKPTNCMSLMHTENKASLDLIIFHEMIHWLHKLDNLKFLSRSKIGEMPDETISVKDHPLFLYYYGDHRSCSISTDNWKTSLIVWNNLADIRKLPPQIRVNFEEMLTICGLPENASGYIFGDELSENLYRAELGLPLRFGHRVITFIEDEAIFRRVYDGIKYYCELLHIDTPACVGPENSEIYIGSARSFNLIEHHGAGKMFFYAISNNDEHLRLFNLLIPARGMYVGTNKPLDSYYYFNEQDCKNIIDRLTLE
jgi:hypothetical protein